MLRLLLPIALGLLPVVRPESGSVAGARPESRSVAAVHPESRSVAGVEMPTRIEVDGRTLELNGMGLRTRTVLAIKVYVAGLYLERPSRDSKAVIASEQTKRVHLVFLRSVDRAQIVEAIEQGFARNSRERMDELRPRLKKLEGFLTSLGEKDRLEITYRPGKGTEVSVKGRVQGVIEGKDFADALFAVWLGKDPVDKSLRKALLGR